MDEVLNQVTETETDDLFGDLVDEDLTPETEETSEEVNDAPEAIEEPFLNIRYNKEDKGLSKDEAIELAQKGMNYDKVLGQFNDLNSKIELLAKANGMKVSEYLDSLSNTQREFEVNKVLQDLKNKYPNSDESLLKEIAEKRVGEQVSAPVEEKADATETSEIERQVDVFLKHYPDLKPDKLDPSVYDLMKEGYTLLEAYSIFKSKEDAKTKAALDSKAKVRTINEENKKRSLGNVSVSGDISSDDFLSGFLG